MSYSIESFPWSSNYDSDLRELILMVKKLMKQYQTLVDGLEAAQNDIKGIKSDFVTLRAEYEIFKVQANAIIANAIAAMKKELAEEKKKIEKEVQAFLLAIREIIKALENDIDNRFDTLNLHIEAKLATMRNYIDAELAKLWDRINEIQPSTIVNPINLETQYLQKAADDLWNFGMREHAMTAAEFTMLNLSVTDYDNKHLTEYEYDYIGRDAIHNFYIHGFTNPITGSKTSIENIISYLATLLIDSLTSDEYTTLDLTSDEYTTLDLTAENFLFYPAGRLTGLTSAEYAKLYIDGIGIARKELEFVY